MSRPVAFTKVFSSFSDAQFSVFIALVICLAWSFAGCSSTHEIAENQTDSTHTENSNSNDQLEELYWSRIDSAKMQFTQADIDFMFGMISHHAQALIMSDLAPKNNASSEIQRLASRIINAQKDEIQSMQKWLRDRDQMVPEVQIDGLQLNIEMESTGKSASINEHSSHAHEGHSGADHLGMPGMLTQEQLRDLASQRGRSFDRAFLKYMIAHHDGALIMVENLFAVNGAAQDEQIFRLASDIQADQSTEIERMKQMLENLTS